jgi:hypothetical protein
MSESFSEQVERVKSMARGDATWDLSDNDTAALKAILVKLEEQGKQNRDLRNELKSLHDGFAQSIEARSKGL